MATIFISHSTKDLHVSSALYNLLSSIGIDGEIFHDQGSIKPGVSWEGEIRESLGKSDFFIVVWSKNVLKSKWVHDEITWAIELNVHFDSPKILPICIDKEPLAFGLEAYQAIKMY